MYTKFKNISLNKKLTNLYFVHFKAVDIQRPNIYFPYFIRSNLYEHLQPLVIILICHLSYLDESDKVIYTTIYD